MVNTKCKYRGDLINQQIWWCERSGDINLLPDYTCRCDDIDHCELYKPLDTIIATTSTAEVCIYNKNGECLCRSADDQTNDFFASNHCINAEECGFYRKNI